MVLLVNFRAGPIAGITGADGQPLQKNPLLDLRVRQAISKAIDRTGLVDRIMGGEAIPASQLTIPTMEGYDTALQVEKADPKGAKALLAEAGYPDGFGLDIACTNNRYPNDDRICQAVGQMLARAGFHAKVETMPISMLMPKLKGTPTQGDIALGMLGLSQGTHPTALTLMVHSADPAVGRGQYNFGEYDNPDMDRMIDQAFTTLDPAKREAAIREAVDRTMHEIVVVPLYFQKVITASRANLTYTTDPTEETLTWRIMPKAK
jgi:peptide/nickel transport system substrate-binding protein